MNKKYRILLTVIVIVLVFVGTASAKVYHVDDLSTDPDTQYLHEIAHDTWNSIAYYVDNETGLPYDNSEDRTYTGIDKIGLYIASVAVAKELGFVSEEEALNRVNKTVNTLLSEDFKTWNGSYTYESPAIRIPYTWYNMTTLEPLPPTDDIDVCTIDLGNYYACLIIGRSAFPELNQSFSKLLNNVNWSLLYNYSKNLFYGGYNTKTCNYSNWSCEYLASDSQTASFIGVATEAVPAKHWEILNRCFEERYGHTYKPGWEEGLFTQFLPGIFIAQRQTLMGRSAEEFTKAQIAHANDIGAPVWGWSPSSSPCGDEYIGCGQLRDEIVTPHASALAVVYQPEEVIQNLKKMEEMCARAPLKMSVLDDFNDGCPPNNWGGNEGVWNSGGAVIKSYFDSKIRHCDCGCSLKLNYDITATGSAGGYWWVFKGCPEFEPADISDYNTFGFRVKGDEEDGYTTKFYLEFADENWTKATKEVAGIDNNWVNISVDLNSLKSEYPKVNWEKMRQVAIVLNQSITAKMGTLYFDDLDFGDETTEYKFGFRDSINWTSGEFSGKFLTLDQAMIFLSIANYLNGTVWRLFMEDSISKKGVSVIEDYQGRVIYFAEGEDWINKSGGGLDNKPHASNCSCLGNGWGNNGEYAEYLINLSENADKVLFKMRYSDKFDANNNANHVFIYLDDELKGELYTEDTGDWDIFKWSDKVDIGYIPAEEHELKIVSGNGGEWNCVNLDCFKLFREEKPTICIVDYPITAYPGKPAAVSVSWENIPTDRGYKLIVQLENWDITPGIVYTKDKIHFYSTGNATFTIDIPAEASSVTGCRFVAAFISKTGGWNDTLVATATSKDVTIESSPPTGWTEGCFRLGTSNDDKEIFIDPEGYPFYPRAIVYAYGPENDTKEITATVLIDELAKMKEHGFNTVNLYPRYGFNSKESCESDFLPQILSWCDKNKMAVYLRIWYINATEFPDFMDEKVRDDSNHSLDAALTLARKHPSVLAMDLDQRWLFIMDWSGSRREGIPKLGNKCVEYMPTWLRDKYNNISTLNELWGKNYSIFTDILNDTEIIIPTDTNTSQKYEFPDLDKNPWRGDIVEYTLWTINDFLIDITKYIKTVDPNHLVTYTTDLAEVVPFPISTKENSGIDFISPVHYNNLEDFYRDWISNGKLLYQSKWLNDLYGMPVFIRESGWRTSTLNQTPSNMGYAWSENESHKAELYLRQASLMNIYPWLPGWSYFKWYDKKEEGDFGYIYDNGSQKPVAVLGQCINERLQINMEREKEPLVWLYYPEYALASPYPGYEHYKTLVLIVENDFLVKHEEMISEAMKHLNFSNFSCENLTNTSLFTDLVATFEEKWIPFAFTSTIPADDKPIILAGRTLEQLSQNDREALLEKKTVTFGPIGISDERYNITEPWYANVVGMEPKSDLVEIPPAHSTSPAVNITAYHTTASAGRSVDVKVAWENIPADKGYKLIVQLENWDITPGIVYTKDRIHFNPSGNATFTIDIPKDHNLTEPISGCRYVAAFINKTEGWNDTLAANFTNKHVEIQPLCRVNVSMGNITCSFLSSWIELPNISNNDSSYLVLANFSSGNLNGYPAIVQSKDGKHTAFLFDALNWEEITSERKKEEISENLTCHAHILKQILEGKNFDTGPGTYPSIMGTHNGTITPAHDVNVSKMYTYPHFGTGGHSESIRIYGKGIDVNGTWKGYQSEDYHYITFYKAFTLVSGVTYNYTIHTGSYPQIHHNRILTVSDGEITCASFVDANEKNIQ